MLQAHETQTLSKVGNSRGGQDNCNSSMSLSSCRALHWISNNEGAWNIHNCQAPRNKIRENFRFSKGGFKEKY
ncbi:unnamed protein product [Ixodes pacificus]